ncbi:MAG: xanthine dehydrogenase family protein [Treponema sp.]|nr:xanthine dehydrogenase family protein [Treponema sp.]
MCAKRKAADKKKILFSDDFYSDMSSEGMLSAVLITSPFAYGTISSVEFSPKTKVPQGYFLFTAKNLGKNERISILGTEVPLLCTGEIAYKGEAVALLVGENREILEELKSSVEINLEKTSLEENESKFSKAVNSLAVSMKDGMPLTQSIADLRHTLQNFSKPHEIIAKRKYTTGNPEEFFNSSKEEQNSEQKEENPEYTIIDGCWKNEITCHTNRETEGAFCYVKGGNLHVFTASQWISELRRILSEVTGFPKEKIIITRTKISVKTTNSLWQNAVFASLTAFASIQTGKPVKLSLSRNAHENLLEAPPEIKISHRTAVDKNGIFSAMDISIEFDAGSANPFASEILDRLSIAATGIYNCKNVRVSAKAIKTHNPPSSLYLSMIDSASFFAVENQVQKIAEVTGFSPIDLRLMNKAGGLQKSTLPFTYSFGRSNDAVNAVAIRSDFKRKYTVFRLMEQNRYEGTLNSSYAPPFRGIAIACAFDGSGYQGTAFEKSGISMQISVNEEKKIIVNAYPPSLSIREIWTKIILENLDVEKRSIIFTNETTEENGKTNDRITCPDTLIGTVSIKTILLKKCVDALKRKKIDGTPFTVKKSLSTSRKTAWSQEEFKGSPYYNTAFGACSLELELDSTTFREKIKKICVIIDGGKILHPKAAENAVHRSVQRCLSTLVNGDSLFSPAPQISVQFTQSEEEPKQIGHLVFSMLPAAYTSALSQALAVTVSSLPLSTNSIFNILERAKKSHERIPEAEK